MSIFGSLLARVHVGERATHPDALAPYRYHNGTTANVILRTSNGMLPFIARIDQTLAEKEAHECVDKGLALIPALDLNAASFIETLALRSGLMTVREQRDHLLNCDGVSYDIQVWFALHRCQERIPPSWLNITPEKDIRLFFEGTRSSSRHIGECVPCLVRPAWDEFGWKFEWTFVPLSAVRQPTDYSVRMSP